MALCQETQKEDHPSVVAWVRCVRECPASRRGSTGRCGQLSSRGGGSCPRRGSAVGDIHVPHIATNPPVQTRVLQNPLSGGGAEGRGVATTTVVVYLLLLGHRQKDKTETHTTIRHGECCRMVGGVTTETNSPYFYTVLTRDSLD